MENSILPKSIHERISSKDICWYLSVFTCEDFFAFFSKVNLPVLTSHKQCDMLFLKVYMETKFVRIIESRGPVPSVAEYNFHVL